MSKRDHQDSGLYMTDKQGNRVEIRETYLCSDHVWVRNPDGSSKVVRTGDLRPEK